MNAPKTTKVKPAGEDPDDSQETARRIPSAKTLLHILWLKKTTIFLVWLALALPTGALLSIFDLRHDYTATTLMRFPNVVGAQTNVMRDVAITQRESILGIFNSFAVLNATVQKLGLRMRITTRDLFFRNTFRALRYSDNLGVGAYHLSIDRGKRDAVIRYRPEKAREDLVMFQGRLSGDGRLSAEGLELELHPGLLKGSGKLEIDMHFSSPEAAVQELKKNMSARAMGASNFQITMRDEDPYLVADILNTLREEFLKVYYGTTEVQDVGILVQMEKDLDLAKQKLDKSQDDLSSYYAAHPELMRAPPEAGVGDNLAYLEARQELDRTQRLRNRLAVVVQAKPAANGTGDQRFYWAGELLAVMSEAGEPKANILRASLQDLNALQSQARATLGPEHPRIREVETQKEDLYRQIDETQVAVLRKLDADIGAAKLRVAGSAPVRQAQIPMRVQLELERLTVVNRNNQGIYDRLQESYNRAKLVTGSEFFKVAVVDPARAAIYVPPSLKTRLIMAAAAVAALLLAVPALFIAWQVLFMKIWTREDVIRLLRIKPLGVMAEAPVPRPAKRKRALAKADPADEPGGSLAARPPDPLLLFYGNRFRLEDLEAYRVIREEIENFFRSGREGKCCLLVTSTQPNEGKTLLSCNLAMTFARKGKRTLLVDADFRLGRVDKVFNLPTATGLDELLAQADLTDEQFREMASMTFQPTMQRNLVVAPHTRFNPNAGELVSSDRFKSFIRMAQEQFDVVLVDTPPVMITPEPLSLATLADGVVFVCRSGGTVLAEALEAVKVLSERGVRVAAILNRLRQSPFAQNRYKKYSYYYHGQSPSADPGGMG